MTGREKIEAALSSEGTDSIPVVIPYESILIRDHWEDFGTEPWWNVSSPDLEVQLKWRRAVLNQIENDFLELPLFYTREEQNALVIEHGELDTLLVNGRNGATKTLERQPIGGGMITNLFQSTGLEAKTTEDIDHLVPPLEKEDPDTFLRSGRADLAVRLIEEYGRERFPIESVRSPLWACDSMWGFEPLMLNIAADPDLVHYACSRYLDYGVRKLYRAAAMGAKGIWIEECLMDLISRDTYAAMNLPYLQRLVEAIHATGLSAILYFCGDPTGKIELILDSGCDAVGFEESKKDFEIDVECLVDQITGRCTLLGNIDSIGIVERGAEQLLRAEITRQIQAGRRNGSRFLTSCGSPLTPATPIKRIQAYLDLAGKLGNSGSTR